MLLGKGFLSILFGKFCLNNVKYLVKFADSLVHILMLKFIFLTADI
jgi:hypothetical protein